jgi:hypothetical protein
VQSELATPGPTHRLSPGFDRHSAQLYLLTIRVPEPRGLLLAAGGCVLGLLFRGRRV